MIIQPNSIASPIARTAANAATSAANTARTGKILPGSSNISGTVAANSTTINLSQSMSLADIAKKYDVRNMSPNEMGKLVGDGKITGGFFVLTEAQFQAAMQANSKGLTGTALQDAMNVANNTQVNYIQLYTKGINDSKLYGVETTGLESILHQMEALQGIHSSTTSA